MTLMTASGGGRDPAPIPGCPGHNPFHRNEGVPLVGQRRLAEQICELLARGVDPIDAEVTATLWAYRAWRDRDVLAAVAAGAQRQQATSSHITQREARNRPVSEECGTYEPERRRIRAAAPVLDALEALWTADHAYEVDDDRRMLATSVERWLSTSASTRVHAHPDHGAGTLDDAVGEQQARLASDLGLTVHEFVELFGTGWTPLSVRDDSLPQEQWWIAGEPVQLMLRLDHPGVTLARPVGRWSTGAGLSYEPGEPHKHVDVRDASGRARAAEMRTDLQRRRRRSFRYCRYCSLLTPPECWHDDTCMACAERWLDVRP